MTFLHGKQNIFSDMIEGFIPSQQIRWRKACCQ